MTRLEVRQQVVAGQRPARARFAVPDELTCYYDRPAEPSNVHLEFRLDGRLDPELFRSAVLEVLAATPRARARRVRAGAWRSRMTWEYPPLPDIDPVLVRPCASTDELARCRAEFLSQSPPLETSPALRILLAREPDADRLILNAHHAVLDGLSCLALIRAVARAYSEPATAGPVPGPAAGLAMPGLATSGLATSGFAGTGFAGAKASAASDGPDSAAGVRDRHSRSRLITRIAADPEPGSGGVLAGYGAQTLSWTPDRASVAALRAADTTVNDLLIAVLMLAIRDWNAAHGQAGARIRITMPISDRASDHETWGNLSRLAAVTSRVPPGAGIGDLLPVVARQTRRAKHQQGPQVDLVSRVLARTPLPVGIKRRLLYAGLAVVGSLVCDTSLVSNLGAIEPIWFGSVPAAQAWFSTSAHMPRGLSLGVITTGGELRLTFRYRRALFSDAAAAAFVGRYDALLAGAITAVAGQ